MKRLVLLSSILFLFTTVYGQTAELAAAKNSFYIAQLDVAKTNIDKAETISIDRFQKNPKRPIDSEIYFWKSKIYTELGIDTTDKYKELNPLSIAVEYYAKTKAAGPSKGFLEAELDELSGRIADILGYRGGVAYQNDDYEGSLNFFLISSEFLPSDTSNYLNIAVVANRLEKKDVTLKALEKLKEMSYKDPFVYFQLATFYKEAGDNDKRLEVIKFGRKLLPSNTDILDLEIGYYVEMNNTDELLSSIKSAIDLNPNDSELYLNLGIIYEKTNNLADAEKAYKKSLELDETNVGALYNMGVLVYNRAVEMVTETNKLPVNSKTLPQIRKLEEEYNKVFRQSLPYFEKALQYDPSEKSTLMALSEVCTRLKMYDKAEQYRTLLNAIK